MTRRSLLHALPLPVLAQSYLSSPRRALTAPELQDAPGEWIERSLAWVDDMLARTPSWQLQSSGLAPVEPSVHRAALIRLDDILHIDSAPAKPLIQQWYRKLMERTSHSCARRSGRRRIVKLYDHGWFIETPSARFAIDLVGGAPGISGFQMSAEARVRFADSADALFISHWHSDHADPEIARLFLARKKPVVAPADVFRDVPELQKQLTVLPRDSARAQTLLNLRVHVHPGHQGRDVINNCYRIEAPGGFSLLHTGDQSNDEDFSWIDTLHRLHPVDLFLPNCWTPQPLRFVAGVKPRLTLPGHENEMAHTVPHREDWTQTFTRFEGCSSLLLPLCWGEEVSVG
jgi:L-ascorbate metabolism protein UlaG (beta-lactamase superfamily)